MRQEFSSSVTRTKVRTSPTKLPSTRLISQLENSPSTIRKELKYIMHHMQISSCMVTKLRCLRKRYFLFLCAILLLLYSILKYTRNIKYLWLIQFSDEVLKSISANNSFNHKYHMGLKQLTNDYKACHILVESTLLPYHVISENIIFQARNLNEKYMT